MPKFKYQLANGKTLTLEGDVQPSDEEVESIAAEQGLQLQPVDTTPAPAQQPPAQTFRPGNIDLTKQPSIPNPQGGKSTVYSRSYNLDGKETLLPSVTPDGRFLQTDEDVINEYRKTGLHLGEFATPEEANRYAEQLHKDYESGKYAPEPSRPTKSPDEMNDLERLVLGLPPKKSRSIYQHIFEAPEFVTSAAKRFSDYITEPELDDSYITALAKGFLGGATEGAASQLSPANVLTAGRGRLPQLASRILGGTQAAHGAYDISQGDTAGGLTDIAFGALNLAPGVNPFRKAEVPSGRPAIKIPEAGAPRPSRNVTTVTKGGKTTTLRSGEELDPNFNQGMGDPELAGATPYPRKAESFDPASLKFADDLKKLEAETAGMKIEHPVTSPERQAAMDARNKGFRGTESEKYARSNQPKPGNPPIKDTPEQVAAQLQKSNEIAKLSNESGKKSLWQEVRDGNRALLTSFDFSAAGRQGKPLMMTKAYWTSFDDMFKSWGSQRAYDNVMESINDLPAFKKPTLANGQRGASLAERAGLDIGGKEETFKSNFAENLIPGVKRSERAYSAFLNKLRADHFNTMVNDARNMGLKPDTNDVVLKQIGSFINDATGRGGLGRLEKAAPILNEVFFAPRLMASRVNMYRRWLNPKTYSNENPVVRKQALKSLISTVGFGVAAGELARQAGAQVSNDPRSSDFRKIKIGNTRIDPFSGFQQYAVGASRLLSGQSTSSKSGKTYSLGEFQPLTSLEITKPYEFNPKSPVQQTRADVVSQFAQNKLAPIPSLVWSWMEGKDWSGEPFDVKAAILDRTVPIVMQDLYELYQEDPSSFPPGFLRDNPELTKIGLGILPIMGEGIQTYGR